MSVAEFVMSLAVNVSPSPPLPFFSIPGYLCGGGRLLLLPSQRQSHLE